MNNGRFVGTTATGEKIYEGVPRPENAESIASDAEFIRAHKTTIQKLRKTEAGVTVTGRTINSERPDNAAELLKQKQEEDFHNAERMKKGISG